RRCRGARRARRRRGGAVRGARWAVARPAARARGRVAAHRAHRARRAREARRREAARGRALRRRARRGDADLPAAARGRLPGRAAAGRAPSLAHGHPDAARAERDTGGVSSDLDASDDIAGPRVESYDLAEVVGRDPDRAASVRYIYARWISRTPEHDRLA